MSFRVSWKLARLEGIKVLINLKIKSGLTLKLLKDPLIHNTGVTWFPLEIPLYLPEQSLWLKIEQVATQVKINTTSEGSQTTTLCKKFTEHQGDSVAAMIIRL